VRHTGNGKIAIEARAGEGGFRGELGRISRLFAKPLNERNTQAETGA
jgi:hypothetical protein